MKEQIVLAPGISGKELISSLALHGVSCFNLRICSSSELARLALMRSGISIPGDMMNTREENAAVAAAVKGNTYFSTPSYSDIQQIAGAIRRIRHLSGGDGDRDAPERHLNQGIFTEKNNALLNAVQRYMQILSEKKSWDALSLISKAAGECGKIDADFIILYEYPLSPLETDLLNRLSGGQYRKIHLQDLYRAADGPVHIESIRNCYGAPNEVETILTHIYRNHPLDQCTVAVTDPQSYGQLFFDYALLYNIPITFGCGIPIINSNPARLLVLYNHWITDGFFDGSALLEMLNSRSFNRTALFDLFPEPPEDFSWSIFYEAVRGLRLTNDRETNALRLAAFRQALDDEEQQTASVSAKDAAAIRRKRPCIPFLEILARELSAPIETFVAKYAYIRRGTGSHADSLLMRLDTAAVKVLCDELRVIRTSGMALAQDDIIKNVLSLSICEPSSEPGKLYVTSIASAGASIRENLYIAGLSASQYPGSPKENYLLLDADLLLFGEEARYLSSSGQIQGKREALINLVHLASCLGSEIHISYSGLNVSELKRDNASSLLFELYRMEHGSTATVKELEQDIISVEYFEPAISVTRHIGDAYNKGYRILKDSVQSHPEGDYGWNLDRAYSPTALELFFSCPRRFMLGRILGIPEPEDSQPFVAFSPLDNGTLAHLLMESLANTEISLTDFLKLCGERFDCYIAEHPPLLPGHLGAIKNQFLEMMETAYRMDPHRPVLLEEESVSCTHSSGVSICGYPDRVEKLPDGSCLIVDFKTGRTIQHQQDDVNTCLQVVLYAYLLEQNGYRVSGCEYRYIRLGQTVTCRYDEDIKLQLSSLLGSFRDAMLSGCFPVTEAPHTGKDSPCRFCGYSGICGKDSEDLPFDESV